MEPREIPFTCCDCGASAYQSPRGRRALRCLPCGKEQALKKERAWKAANRERIREQQRARYQQNPSHYDAQTARYHLLKKYGLTLEAYETLLAEQGGGCAICGSTPTTKRLAVDHCHDTGSVRGLLCGNCNTGIGKLGDTVEALRRALAYLEAAV